MYIDLWQDAAVAVIVLAAVGYLARSGWRLVRRNAASSCGGGCGDCPASNTEQKEIVQIEVRGAQPRSEPPRAS
jgi:hypothetical protein